MNKIPNHIGFIMDGNGRWAKKRNMPRTYGHKKGVEALEKIINACINRGIKYISVYAFSTENWNRPEKEITALFDMITEFNNKKLEYYRKKGVKVRFVGDLSVLPEKTKKSIESITKNTENNNTLVFNICLNYSGRQEILYAVNKILAGGKTEVTENELRDNMFFAGIPDPDIIVRSSGEMRLSNFMLYEIAYSELVFIDKLWPDFDEETLDKILEIYQNRDRRFGGITEE